MSMKSMMPVTERAGEIASTVRRVVNVSVTVGVLLAVVAYLIIEGGLIVAGPQ